MGSSRKFFLAFVVIALSTSPIISNGSIVMQNFSWHPPMENPNYEYTTVEVETHQRTIERSSARNFTHVPNVKLNREVIVTILNCALPLDQPLLKTFKLKSDKSISKLSIIHQCKINDSKQNATKIIFHGLNELENLQWNVNSKAINLDRNVFSELVSLEELNITGAVICRLESESKRYELIFNDLLVTNRNLRIFSLTFMYAIKTLSSQFLANLPLLSKVYLNNNQISNISSNVFKGSKNIGYLNLSHNNLTIIPEALIEDQVKLEFLYLEDNKIETLSDGLFRNAQELQVLWLADNRLQYISGTLFTSLANLTELHLENNNLHTIDQLAFQNLTTLHTLNLQNNNLIFDSTSFQYLDNVQILNLRNNRNTSLCHGSVLQLLICMYRNHETINNTTTESQNHQNSELNWNLILIGITLTIVALLIGIVLYFKNQTKVKILLYNNNLIVTGDDKNKLYDAFISYSYKDEDFVTNHLIPTLEKEPLNFKICWHMRDWVPGELITTQIVRSIRSSRRTLVVLSENFLDSVWGQLEFRAAHLASMAEKRVRVVAIMYGEIENASEEDHILQTYLKSRMYVKWGDPWFWDKLQEAIGDAKSGRKFKRSSV